VYYYANFLLFVQNKIKINKEIRYLSARLLLVNFSMAANRWLFTADQLANTPSRKCGIDGEKESNYRQQAASLIQDMGQRLQVYPLITGSLC